MAIPNFNFHTTSEEVASYYSSQIKDKTILITGVSPGGLGLHTAKTLAAHSPALLILAGRNSSTLTTAQSEIATVAPNCPIKLLTLDLSSLHTVRTAAAEVLSWTDVPKIDIFINNAGIMGGPFKLSPDGIEAQFATNHLGPWLFTNLLISKILAAQGRLVWLSSVGHMYSPIRFDDYNFQDGQACNPDVAYGQSKTANILTARSFARKLAHRKVTSFSVHPGLVLTNITRDISVETLQAKGFLDADGNFTGIVPKKTFSQGCATSLVAALAPEIEGKSGAYMADCRVVGDEDETYAEWAKDESKDESLWELSESLVGEKFAY